jgi:NTE family protein
MNVGLALSGGGYRAAVFHLGVLARLAEDQVLEQVSVLSTVSGGSLCIGLVEGLNGMRWPSSAEYQERVVGEARRILTTTNLQKDLITRALGSFWTLFGSRADDLSALIQKSWGLTARLDELPDHPHWLINTTCYETGKNFRFEKRRMGDYVFGYSRDTGQVPLSDAMAASAGFPGGIGALPFETTSKKWFKYSNGPAPVLAGSHAAAPTQPVEPMFPQVHLWDGGAYDNHGLEGVHDFIKGWQLGIEFLIVSDAAGRPKPEAYHVGPKAIGRLMTSIMMDQVRSLRARAIIERFVNHKDKGVFLQTGNTAEQIIRSSRRDSGLAPAEIETEIARLAPDCLDDAEAQKAAGMGTVIRQLTEEEFERLFRHGFEVADLTLFSYYPETFQHIKYSPRPQGS